MCCQECGKGIQKRSNPSPNLNPNLNPNSNPNPNPKCGKGNHTRCTSITMKIATETIVLPGPACLDGFLRGLCTAVRAEGYKSAEVLEAGEHEDTRNPQAHESLSQHDEAVMELWMAVLAFGPTSIHQETLTLLKIYAQLLVNDLGNAVVETRLFVRK